MDSKYIEREWPIPQNAKAVERFLGFANYHRNFIARFFETVAPPYAMTGKVMGGGRGRKNSCSLLMLSLND